MRNVETARIQASPNLTGRERIHRQTKRHPQRQSMNWDSRICLDNPMTLTSAARGGGEHLDVMTGLEELLPKVANLRLDPPHAGRVAVRKQGDLHPARVPWGKMTPT
jgi:hypothetical protein